MTLSKPLQQAVTRHRKRAASASFHDVLGAQHAAGAALNCGVSTMAYERRGLDVFFAGGEALECVYLSQKSDCSSQSLRTLAENAGDGLGS